MDISKALLLILLLASFRSQASEVVYAPGFCEPSDLMVFISNKSPQPQRAWSQVRIDDEIQEMHYDIEANSQIKVAGTAFLDSKRGYSFKSLERGTLTYSSVCTESLKSNLTDLTSPSVVHSMNTTKSAKVHLLNLFLKPQKVKLKALNFWGAIVDSKEIQLEKYYDTASVKWIFPSEVSRIEILGEERLHSEVFYENQGEEKSATANYVKPVTLPAPTQKTYFLVSTKYSRPEEAFVVGFEDPKQIETAREQIQNRSLEKIIVGRIELGHGGFNRAFLAKDRSPYSWSVYQVDAFADFAHIDCDGSPDLTEERLYQKLNEGGRICFWRYRIIKELKPEEVASGKLKP